MWTAVLVRLSESADDLVVDVASGELFQLGAEGIEQRDGPPLELVASFPPSSVPETLIGEVQAALQRLELAVADIRVETWPDIDWATHWRRHFRPLSFGRVWVVPHWLEAPDEAEVVLRIDPKMAFGTGLHATTALCMERIVALSPIDTLLDVGTGTGILALGAAALGARVIGTDNDPEAVRSARENAGLNGLTAQSEFVDADVTLDSTFSVVVANILAEPLIDMAGRLSARVAPEGRLLLSGLMASQADAVIAAYRAEGLGTPIVVRREEWVTLEFQRAT